MVNKIRLLNGDIRQVENGGHFAPLTEQAALTKTSARTPGHRQPPQWNLPLKGGFRMKPFASRCSRAPASKKTLEVGHGPVLVGHQEHEGVHWTHCPLQMIALCSRFLDNWHYIVMKSSLGKTMDRRKAGKTSGVPIFMKPSEHASKQLNWNQVGSFTRHSNH